MIQTARLRLEPVSPDHAEVLFEGLRDPRLYSFIAEEPPASADALRARYTKLATRRSPDGAERWLNWAVRHRRRDAYLGYAQATIRADRSASVAYVIFHAAWGKGYAVEAMSGVLRTLGEHYGCSAAHASVEPAHARSIAVLDALGFTAVGRSDEGLLYRRALPVSGGGEAV